MKRKIKPTDLEAIYFLAILSVLFPCALCERLSTEEVSIITSDLIAAGQHMASSMNTSVNPCEDFYAYACGGAIAAQPIPKYAPDSELRGFIEKQTPLRMRTLLERSLLAKKKHPAKSVQMLIDLYGECVDAETRDRRGLAPLKALLRDILGSEWPAKNESTLLKSRFELQNGTGGLLQTLARMEELGVNPLFRFYIPKKSLHGRGLRPQFINNFPRERKRMFANIDGSHTAQFDQYQRQMKELGALFLAANSTEMKTAVNTRLEEVFAFERSLALPQKEDSHDDWQRSLNLNAFTLETRDNPINFTSYLNELAQLHKAPYRFNQSEEVTVDQIGYYRKLSKLLATTPPLTLHNFFGLKLVEEFLKVTDNAGRQWTFPGDFESFHKIKADELKPLWTECVYNLMEWAPSRLFLDALDLPNTKARIQALVADLGEAMQNQTHSLDWMDNQTKQKTLELLATLQSSISLPEELLNDTALDLIYKFTPESSVQVKKGQYFESYLTLVRHQKALPFIELCEPFRRYELNKWVPWPSFRKDTQDLVIELWYGLLQPPFYFVNSTVPVGLNYGALGNLISQSIASKFDIIDTSKLDQSERTDWPKETRANYRNRSQCFIEQYSSIVDRQTGIRLNGTNLLVNVEIDNSALQTAYLAFEARLKKDGGKNSAMQKLPTLKQFTPQQLFFLSFSQTMCRRISAEEKERMIKHGRKLPYEYQVNMPLANLKQFSAAFNCPVESKMNPMKKCRVW